MTPLTALAIGVALLQIEAPDAGSTPPPTEPPAVRPTTPGEPVIDRSLPPGTLVVDLRDADLKPLANAEIVVESAGQQQRGRRLVAETDGNGRIRVEDLPTTEAETIVVGHRSERGLLTSTRPFALPTDGGARVLLVAPATTGDAGAVTLAHLHVVLEREGSQLRVSETLGLATPPGAIYENDDGLPLPLPADGRGFRFGDAEQAAELARLDDGQLVITAPISPGGIELTIVFDIPIEDGLAALEQEFPLPVGATQVISTWTHAGAQLTVDGFSDAEPTELRSGLTAQVAATQGLPDGRLKLKLEGIVDGPAAIRRTVTFAASALALALGLVLWITRRTRREPKGRDDD